jgi:murE/murF fusion protein
MLKISEILEHLACNQKKFQAFNFYDQDKTINKIKTDSRKISPGNLFIPLNGENFDGHDFIFHSLKSGASCIIFEIEKIHKIQNLFSEYGNVIFIGLENFSTLNFYGFLANFYRKKYLSHIKIIAITGSVGKTSLKNLLGHSLSLFKPEKVYISHGNFNNFIGVPFNIFEIEINKEIAVLELGMNSPGEISYLSKIINPDYAIINNISPSHIGNFFNKNYLPISEKEIQEEFEDSLKKIALEKSGIFDGLKESGLVILNKNIAFFEEVLFQARKKTNQIKIYNLKKDSISDLYISDENNDYFLISIKKILEKKIKIPNSLNQNLLSALLASICLIEFCDFINENEKNENNYLKILENFNINENLNGRGALKNISHKYIIDETYNAGFDSVFSSIQNLSKITNSEINFKRKILILGAMGELGVFSDFLHERLFPILLSSNFDSIILIDKKIKSLYFKLQNANLKNLYFFENKNDLIENLNNLIMNHDLILIKGGNSLELWKIIESF